MNPNDVAITNCDLEPVHIPGRIQSFGALIAFDTQTMCISYRSENITSLFPDIDQEVLGTSVENFAGNSTFAHAVRGALGLPTVTLTRETIGTFKIGQRLADVSISIQHNIAIVELEPVESTAISGYLTPIARLKSTLLNLQSHQDLDRLLNSATQALRRMTGFDRVMAYQFLEDDSGEVIAEARSPGVEAYLGLRYPASDIPKQVRELMIRVPFRAFGNVDDPHAGIVAADPQLPPLDLSMTHLRGVSPIHIQYLKNMGVTSTMNLSIIVHGKLWGLFAFHHYHPNHLNANERSLCELFGHFASLEIQQQIERECLSQDRRIKSMVQTLRDSEPSSLASCIEDNAEILLKSMGAQGVCLITDEQVNHSGEVPTDSMIRRLAEIAKDDVLSLNSLRGIELKANESDTQIGSHIAGALMYRLNSKNDSWIAFFRNSVEKEIRWAGNKQKTVEHGPKGPRLLPRSSFAEYCETVEGQSESWSRDDHKTAAAIQMTLRELSYSNAGELAAELQRTNEHQNLLINELNHRVRNIITLVRSIARQTSTHIQSLPQYITNFEKRLMALATAHNLIGGSGMQWANLRHILNIELKAYRSAYTDAITIDGPNVALASDVVPIMTLVIHELATNAVKHGALSKHGKTLKVSWTLDSGGLRLVWEEKVDRITSPPQQINFGLTLIQQALPSECDGECQLDFQPDGMIAKFWLPQQSVQKLSDTQAQQSHEFPDEIQPAHQQADMPSLKPLRALILEDKSILAMEMQSMLELLGFTDILVLSKINPELHDQQFKMIEVAILDIDLGKGHNSFAFAEHLQRLGVPFIFVSGFDETFDYPEIFQTVPRLLKPVSVNDLKRTITQVTRTSQ